MALMTQTILTMAVHNCPDTLARISQKISSDYTAEFTAAVESYDSDTINNILQKEVCRCLGTSFLSYGLEQYCQKFGITDDLYTLDDIARILLIDRYRDEIDQQLRDAGM